MLEEPEQPVSALVPASGSFIWEGRNVPLVTQDAHLKIQISFWAAKSHNSETEPTTSWQSHKVKVYQLSQPLFVHIKRLVHKKCCLLCVFAVSITCLVKVELTTTTVNFSQSVWSMAACYLVLYNYLLYVLILRCRSCSGHFYCRWQ